MSLRPAYLSPTDLIPLADPKKIDLPFSRRVLGRRIVVGAFPPVVRINGRLFITRAELEKFKAQLACAPNVQPFELPSQVAP
jgi:hypothetical protein